jgi:hypothetical protein
MNTIQLYNDYGEGMTIARRPDGRILVCHDDATAPDEFAEFIDVGVTVAGHPLIGAHLLTDDGLMILNADEARQIREAAAKLASGAAE